MVKLVFIETFEIVEAKQCEQECFSEIYHRTGWGTPYNYAVAYDKDNNDILFFYPINELKMKTTNPYEREYVDKLKQSWRNLGYRVSEEHLAKSFNYLLIGFEAHVFRLKRITK